MTNKLNSGRVALYVPNFVGGGAERNMIALANAFIERDLEVDFLVATDNGPLRDLLHPSAQVVNFDTGVVLATAPGVARYLRRRQPFALLTTLIRADIAALWGKYLARSRTRVVFRVANNFTAESKNAVRRSDVILPPLVKLFYPRADAIVGVSEGVADDIAAYLNLPRKRVDRVYNPVAVETLRERAAAPLDHPFFQPGQPPVILGVGKSSPQKDFPTLVRAFDAVQQQRDARLIILGGDGLDRPKIDALIAERGLQDKVDLPGFTTNPYAYMGRAAVMALSSRWEGFSNVLVEAIACGTPVVATDCPSSPREILDNGRYGALVPVGDADALANAILQTLASPTPEALLQQRAADFTVDRAADAYLRILRGDV